MRSARGGRALCARWVATDCHLECLLIVTDCPACALYVPDGWGHAVLNLQPSVGFAAEVATARGHSMRLELRAAR